MLIFASIVFYLSLGLLLYMFFSKDRAPLNHESLEEKLEQTLDFAKRVYSYMNKRTAYLLFHYAIESIEEAFLRNTRKLKNVVPKMKKKEQKTVADIKARVVKKPEIQRAGVVPKMSQNQLPKR